MIKIVYSNGLFAPIIVCDVCGKRIKGSLAGAVVYNMELAETEHSNDIPVKYVHKGICMDTAELELGGVVEVGWEELNSHLVHLIENTIMLNDFIDHTQQFLSL